MANLSKSDLLSDLPLSIIHVILSLVPIRDAVRTSILSSQWRFIWSSLPRLVFDETYVDLERDSDLKSMFHFINQALFLHNGPIHEFRFRMLLDDISTVHGEPVDQWLLFLSRNDIRILSVEFNYPVHSSMYSCQYLTHLKLRVHDIPPLPPSFKGFLFLRRFDVRTHLDCSEIIESIVAHSPVLDELKLDYLDFSEMTICSPSLKNLHLSSLDGHLSLCTPLLQELKGCFADTMWFSIGVDSVMFLHLRTIKLSCAPFGDKKTTPAVIRLITSSPNLQKLEISDWGADENEEEEPYEDDEVEPDYFWDTESAPYIKYDSLKVIKMDDCCGQLNEMKLIEFLLARSSGLETLMYRLYPPISDEKLLQLTTQLLRYRRASANAEIVIRKHSKKRRRY